MARRRCLSFLTLLLSAAYVSYSSHVDEPLLPMATVTPDDPTIVLYNITSSGENTVLTLNCTGEGTLAWFRGSPAESVPNTYTTSINGTLVLEISPIVDGVDATEDGLSYFCTASNSLGVARSHTVTVIYAFFNGFSSPANTTIEVVVDEMEAVGLSCNVQEAQPPPEIVWYKNDAIIDTTVTRYNVLDGGDTLVIYDVVASDVTGVEYRCVVTNARMFETVNSSYIYTLNGITLSSNQFIIYRQPRNRSVTQAETDDGLKFYYIGATSGTSTRGSAVDDEGLFTATPVANDLSVSLSNINVPSDSVIVEFFLRESSSGGILDGTTVNVMVSFIDPLTIQQRPSDTMTVYHRFAMETISFTCSGTGTGVQLFWYKDDARIEGEMSDLTFNNLTVSDSGVYQCFWEGEDGTRDMDTWALTVQQPIPPRDFSFTSTGMTYPEGTIVPNGTTIQLTLTVVADSLPSIVWYFNSSSDSSTTIDFDTNPSYNTSNVTRMDDNDDVYEVSITIAVDSTTSGHYEAVVDDTRTEPTRSGLYFVSQEVAVSIDSFEITTSNRCLVQGQVTTLVCNANGLPTPTITFEKDNDDAFDCGNRCTISGSTLTFTDPSGDDTGVYGCQANNIISPAVDINLNLGSMTTLQYCVPPTVTAVEPRVDANEEGIVTLSCNVSSQPTTNTEVFWFKDNGTTPLQDNDRINIGTSGNSIYDLSIPSAMATDEGTYRCVANNTLIPQNSAASIILTITESTTSPTPLPIYVPIVAAVGGLLVVLVVAAIIGIACICCCGIGKRESYSTRKTSGDYTDGRGNVDADSDEEDHQYHNEPEEFQPQYESLPVLRPAQPPEYKPSPAYNNFGPMDDMEMVKVPPPDTESTAFEYNPQSQGYLPNSGPMTSSNMGMQARFDDFMTEDSQFV